MAISHDVRLISVRRLGTRLIRPEMRIEARIEVESSRIEAESRAAGRNAGIRLTR